MSENLDRRDVLALASIATAAAVAGLPATAEAAGAKPMTYSPQPLPFDPNGIKGFSAKLLSSHYDNNYTGAVKRLNAINEELARLDWAKAPTFTINGLKREELIAMNSMALHELYFEGIGAGGDPSGGLAKAVERDFSSIAKWREQFAALGKAQGGGSGWVLLCYLPRDKRLVNAWAADHTMTPANGRPLMALDMYEHAYAIDFGAKAAAYVDAYMGALKWDTAAKLFDRYSAE